MNKVWASYDAKNYVVKDISLSIDRGTNYAIVGQSGSGKSTLLKLVNGMMNPSKGQVKFDYQSPNTRNKNFKKAIKVGLKRDIYLGVKEKRYGQKDNILVGVNIILKKQLSYYLN